MISTWEEINGKILVKTPYCDEVVKTCRKWAGKFDKVAGGWVLPLTRKADMVELIGQDKDDQVEVEVGSDDWRGYQQIHVGWYVLAGRRARDYAADVYADLIAGEVPASGGSVKNPAVAPSADARFRLWVPRDFALAHGLEVVTDPLSPDACEQLETASNPLSAFSDAELMAELDRRKGAGAAEATCNMHSS